MKKESVIGVTVLMLIIGLGIGYLVKPVPEVPEVEKPKYLLKFVAHGGPEADPYWAGVVMGIKDAEKRLPIKCEFFSPPGEYSIKAWADMVESVVASKPDAIITTATDPQAIEGIIKKAIDEGIPVLCFDTEDTRPVEKKIPYLGYVGMSDYLTGVKLAERTLREITPKRAAALIHEVGHIGLEDRARGYKDVLEPKGTIVDKVDITRDPAKMGELLKSYLIAHPDCEAIMDVGAVTHASILSVLEEMGLAGKIYWAGVNIEDTIVKAIKEGKALCAAAEQPYEIGYLSAVEMYLYLEYGVIPPAAIYSGPAVVDRMLVEVIERQLGIVGVV